MVKELALPATLSRAKQKRITQAHSVTVLGELPLPLPSATCTHDAGVKPPSKLPQRTRCLHCFSFKEILFPYVSLPSHTAQFPLARLVQCSLLSGTLFAEDLEICYPVSKVQEDMVQDMVQS